MKECVKQIYDFPILVFHTYTTTLAFSSAPNALKDLHKKTTHTATTKKMLRSPLPKLYTRRVCSTVPTYAFYPAVIVSIREIRARTVSAYVRFHPHVGVIVRWYAHKHRQRAVCFITDITESNNIFK